VNLGAIVLGLSTDSVKSHEKFAAKYGFPYPLLADEDAKVATAYDVYKEKSMYGKTYMGIDRSTFVIDAAGHLARIYPKVKVDGHAQAVLEDLQMMV